jgi:hypothetical protein
MKRTKLFTLLLTLTIVLTMSWMVFADDYTAEGGTYTYNGSDIELTEGQTISEAVDQLEPGDTVRITLTYTNNSPYTTEWYMENTVLKTLEEEAGMDGGYTYVLSNIGPDGKETTIFDTKEKAVGGAERKGGTGLEQATNATEGELYSQDYFFIQELKANESGNTVLTVGLDGETLANIYETRDARIQIGYAVEQQESGETVYRHIKGKSSINTGDTTDILGPAAVFLGAFLMLIIAIISYKKDRKDGENE